MRLLVVSLAAVSFFASAAIAHADGLDYNPNQGATFIDTGYVTGLFGAQTVTNSLVTVTVSYTAAEMAQNIAAGNTTDLLDDEFGQSVTVDIAGVGDFSGADDYVVDPSSFFIFDLNNKGSVPYPFGGLGPACVPDINLPCPPYFQTSGGNLYILAESGPYTQAGFLTSETPEPSTIALLATGLLGMAGVFRRRLSSQPYNP